MSEPTPTPIPPCTPGELARLRAAVEREHEALLAALDREIAPVQEEAIMLLGVQTRRAKHSRAWIDAVDAGTRRSLERRGLVVAVDTARRCDGRRVGYRLTKVGSLVEAGLRARGEATPRPTPRPTPRGDARARGMNR